VRPYGWRVPARMACSSSGSTASPLSAGDSPPALSAQDAADRPIAAQDAAASAFEAHEAVAQLAELHEADAQLALDHDALAQEADAQDALAHDASSFAFEAQLAASNNGWPDSGSVTMNASSEAFGFGGLRISTDRAALTSPTPTESGAASGIALAPSIRAPLTWSGV